jgi:DNA helicase HerA-like ATPase
MRIQLSDDVTLDLAGPPYDTEGLTVCILGNKGSGKSNTMAVIAEEAHRNQIPFIYYDPNGDAVSLRELGDDVLTIGNPAHPQQIRRADYPLEVTLAEAGDFVQMVLRDGYSLVVDLADQESPAHPLDVFTALLNRHYSQAGRLRLPAFVLVDEAQAFAPQSGADKEEKVSRRVLRKVAADGRKRGMLLAVATQRPTYLDKALIYGANVRIFGKCTYFPDFEDIRNYTPTSFQQLRALRSGEVYIVSEHALGKTQIKRRQTTDLGRTPAFQARARGKRPGKKQLQFSFMED